MDQQKSKGSKSAQEAAERNELAIKNFLRLEGEKLKDAAKTKTPLSFADNLIE
jgi:hypothetical protein